MFSKLLKYDFRSLTKFGLPISIITLGLGMLGAIDAFFAFRALFTEIYEGDGSFGVVMFSSLGLISLIFIIYGILLCATIMQIIVYVNYYKTLCTDQGYLTFTLPVKQKDILLSKSLNSFIWGAIVTVAIIVSLAAIIMAIYFGVESVTPSNPTAPDDSLYPTDTMTGVWEVILILLTVILYALNNTQLIFMVIFFASVISKKNKGLVAIGLVVATNLVYSILSSLVSSIISFSAISSSTNTLIIEQLIYIAFLIGTGIAYFFLTKNMMEKKLNLP